MFFTDLPPKQPPKVKRNDAYKILRNLDSVPCENDLELTISSKLGNLTPGKLVDQLQSYSNNDDQTVELNRRCRAAGLRFYFDEGDLVQFRLQNEGDHHV